MGNSSFLAELFDPVVEQRCSIIPNLVRFAIDPALDSSAFLHIHILQSMTSSDTYSMIFPSFHLPLFESVQYKLKVQLIIFPTQW